MIEFAIENIGGIRSGTADIDTGLNVVRAENWQGKSSFVTAIQVVMGTTGDEGEKHPLRDGASEGRVRLVSDSQKYETKLFREGRTVRQEGDVYLTEKQDRICARLFAFLGENNPVRAAVRGGEYLGTLLTKPLDIEDIDSQIARLKEEKQSVESELQQAREASERIVSVQEKIAELETEIEQLQAKREQLRTDSGAAGTDDTNDRLSSKRAEKEQLTNQITTLQNKIERQESQLEDRRSELAELAVPEEPTSTAEIEKKRERIRELETNSTLLEDLYRTNKRVLDEGKAGLVTEIEHSLVDDELTCWICGEQTAESTIADRLAAIEERVEAFQSEREQLEAEIESIQEQREEIRAKRQKQEDLEAEITELEVEIEENRSRLADRENRLAELTEEVERLQETVTETTEQRTEVESELKYRQSELEELREKLESLESRAENREQLLEDRDQLQSEIESLRSRKNEKKREVAERFETTMTEIITRFDLGFESARLAPKTDTEGEITDYELIIARDGRETAREALSEGEVELLGIVTALAGYETYNVSERVPLTLLDGLTALSKENYYQIVEYLRDRTECLVTTAYPEVDEFDGHTISPYEWDVVSRRQPSVS
jgi:chromosome segregation ATPase